MPVTNGPTAKASRTALAFKRGQTTAEYVIGLGLVAVAAVGLLAAYGSELRMKVATLTAALGGNAEAYTESQDLESVIGFEANERARRDVDMRGAEADELNYGTARD